MSLPPGPSAPPIVHTVRWMRRPLEFLDSCRRRYGDAFSVTFVGFQSPSVFISDPDAIRDLYRSRENRLPPGRTVALEPVMGRRSVLLLEGADHLSRRKLMLPPFHGERMRAYEAVIAEAINAEIDSWATGVEFPVHPRMQAVTLEVIVRAVFGVSDPGRLEALRGRLGPMLAHLADPGIQLKALLAQRFGRSDPLEALRRDVEAVDELLYAEIADRRADPALQQREDILAMLVTARLENGDGLDDRELRDQLVTLLLAGHETTATALAWTFDLLLRNPRPLARLRAQLAEGDDRYLRAVITEALRLRPVVPLAGRRLADELRVGEWLLPPGTDVTPAFWLTHTRPDLYPEPLAFRPERFLSNPPETYAWVPFGGGVRRCLGAAFAEFEMRVVLREVLTRCDLGGVRRSPERIARRNVTFSPRHGTPVIVTERAPRAALDSRFQVA
jgi:cytochrome P450 family 135